MVISLAFLVLALRGIRLADLWAALREANYAWLIPGVLITVALLFLKGWRWQLLFVPEYRLRFWSVFTAMCAGYLASNVLPGRAGELVRLVLVSTEEKVSAARTLSTIVVERLLDILTLLVILLLLLPFVALPGDMTRSAQVLGVAALAGAAAMVVLSFWKERVLGWAHAMFRRVRFLDRPGTYAALGHLIDGFAALRGRLGLWLVGISFLGWVGVIGMAWSSARAVHLAAPVTAIVFAVVVTTLGMLLPSTPGYIGVFHYLVTVALAPFGVPKEQALTFALVWHGVNYLTLSLSGVVALWLHGTSFGQVLGRWRARGAHRSRFWGATARGCQGAAGPRSRGDVESRRQSQPTNEAGVKILFVLTYYRPHVSGLTIYVERLATTLAERGHQVTILTSHYAKDLPYEEQSGGVRVVRVPVAFRFSKGVFMPTFPLAAWREIRAHDVVNIHLPQVEAALGTLLAWIAGRRSIVTYHCDLEMPPVWYGRAVDRLTSWNNLVACRLADTIVTNTEDFACHSPVLARFGLVSAGTGKVRAVIPPITIAEPAPGGRQAFRTQLGLAAGQPVVGFVGRFAHEKGVDYLINAIPRVAARIPDVRFVFAGPKDAVGETTWHDLQPLIEKYRAYMTFLGTLPAASMPDFFAACDVITVPSINNTESFGMVQAEAFMCGTPVVASNLPGVRQPVAMSGMGEVVPVADVEALAQGIVKVLTHRDAYIRPHDEIMRLFGMVHTVDAYEKLFEEKRR